MPERPTPRPFAIEVSDAVLADLRERLARTRWAAPDVEAPWAAGADVAYVRELCEHWRTGYDWRAREAALNRFPGFLAEVDGLDLHFWHVPATGPAPEALLLIHGWPGSMADFAKVVAPLADPAAHGGDPADAFDVVVAGLPGCGFGGKPREPGWNVSRIAAAFHALMTDVLGCPRYGIQGGDWGAFIGTRMAASHPQEVLGLHLNFVLGRAQLPESALPEPQTDEERRIVARRRAFGTQETAYSLTHATKPASLGIAQEDSPAGLAAWIVEKPPRRRTSCPPRGRGSSATTTWCAGRTSRAAGTSRRSSSRSGWSATCAPSSGAAESLRPAMRRGNRWR